MKKILQLLLISCLTLGVISCGKDDPLSTGSSNDGGGGSVISKITMKEIKVPDNITINLAYIHHLVEASYNPQLGEHPVIFTEKTIQREVADDVTDTPHIPPFVTACYDIDTAINKYSIYPKTMKLFSQSINKYKTVEASATHKYPLLYGSLNIPSARKFMEETRISGFNKNDKVYIKMYNAILDKEGNIIAKSEEFKYTYIVQ